MKPRKEGETDAAYIRRLEEQNKSLKQHNDKLTKWQQDLTEAVTILSTNASTAFQLMAEKAGVRSHPSVTAVVELFDVIAHPQWRGEKKIPGLKFPQFWDLDGPTAQSGDADMILNAPIAEAIEFLEHLKFSKGEKQFQYINELMGKLHQVAIRGVEGVKERHGFKPKHFSIPSGHNKDLDADALRERLEAVSWMALDLAQDMAFANECLRRDLRAATYRRIGADLYRLAWCDAEPRDSNFDIKIIGGEQDSF